MYQLRDKIIFLYLCECVCPILLPGLSVILHMIHSENIYIYLYAVNSSCMHNSSTLPENRSCTLLHSLSFLMIFYKSLFNRIWMGWSGQSTPFKPFQRQFIYVSLWIFPTFWRPMAVQVILYHCHW